MALRYQVDRLERAGGLDGLVGALTNVGERVVPDTGRVRNLAHGSWLGHPLHPMLTDVVIGAWSSALLLDLAGGERAQPAADQLVTAGLLAAVPTAYTGLTDWVALGQATKEKRVGSVHAVANYVATGLQLASVVARRRGRRGLATGLSLAANGVLGVGGYLGGHLAYRQRVGVNHADAGATDWSTVLPLAQLPERTLVRAEVGGTAVAVYRRGDDVRVLGAACSHLGGPLDEGSVEPISGEDCLVCPWHGSAFALDSGRVVLAPATSPAPAYDVRIAGGVVQARLRPSPVTETTVSHT
jgi:nitrite reductase/ring-hydroxylating ferredoxin subunit/uncharacterized membrane protein